MSSKKGSGFERDLCHLLSKWWSRDERSDIFWRTAGSGARATTRRKKGKATVNQSNDLCAIAPDGQPFVDLVACEFKRGYNQVSVADLLDNGARQPVRKVAASKYKQDNYKAWLTKLIATQQAIGARYWMLIHKRDHRMPVVLMPYLLLADLVLECAFCQNTYLVKPLLTLRCEFANWNGEIVAMHLEDFVRGVKADHFIELHKMYFKGNRNVG